MSEYTKLLSLLVEAIELLRHCIDLVEGYQEEDVPDSDYSGTNMSDAITI